MTESSLDITLLISVFNLSNCDGVSVPSNTDS